MANKIDHSKMSDSELQDFIVKRREDRDAATSDLKIAIAERDKRQKSKDPVGPTTVVAAPSIESGEKFSKV